MATPPAAKLVVEAEWPRWPVSVGMVTQLEVSCWACHAMHKVVALASSSRPPLAGWRISAVWSVCIRCSLSVAWRFFVLAWYRVLLQSLCRMPG